MSCVTPNVRYMVKANGMKCTVSYPCGKCFECLRRERYRWCSRLSMEFAQAKTAYFITFTYDDSHLPPFGSLDRDRAKSLVRNLIPHVKKKVYNISYFLVGEYGFEGNRPHYHLILMNYPLDNIDMHNKCMRLWPEGHVDICYLSGALINYATKYIIKDVSSSSFDPQSLGLQKEFRMMSRNLGFGLLDPGIVKYALANKGFCRLPFNGGTFMLERQFLVKFLKLHPRLMDEPYLSMVHDYSLDTAVKLFMKMRGFFASREYNKKFDDEYYKYLEEGEHYEKVLVERDMRNRYSAQRTEQIKRINQKLKK